MRRLRIYIKGESPDANTEGISPAFLRRWIDALVRAFVSSTGAEPDQLRITNLEGGSIDALFGSHEDQLVDRFADQILTAATKKGPSVDPRVRAFIDEGPGGFEQLYQVYEGDRLVKEMRATPREIKRRQRSVPVPEMRVFDCRLEEVVCAPRVLLLRDENDRPYKVSCTSEQSQQALELADRPDTPQLVVTVVSLIDKTFRLVALRSADEQLAWDERVEEHQETFNVDEYIAKRGDTLLARLKAGH